MGLIKFPNGKVGCRDCRDCCIEENLRSCPQSEVKNEN